MRVRQRDRTGGASAGNRRRRKDAKLTTRATAAGVRRLSTPSPTRRRRSGCGGDILQRVRAVQAGRRRPRIVSVSVVVRRPRMREAVQTRASGSHPEVQTEVALASVGGHRVVCPRSLGYRGLPCPLSFVGARVLDAHPPRSGLGQRHPSMVQWLVFL